MKLPTYQYGGGDVISQILGLVFYVILLIGFFLILRIYRVIQKIEQKLGLAKSVATLEGRQPVQENAVKAENTVTSSPSKPTSVMKSIIVYCRYCGEANKSDAVFCQKCGKSIG